MPNLSSLDTTIAWLNFELIHADRLRAIYGPKNRTHIDRQTYKQTENHKFPWGVSKNEMELKYTVSLLT